jgi:hypothetical protein
MFFGGAILDIKKYMCMLGSAHSASLYFSVYKSSILVNLEAAVKQNPKNISRLIGI